MGMLEQLIEQDYKLTGSGRWLHAEEHDSLVVDAERQLFWWNSIGITGDAFIWLTKIKHMSYEQAKEVLKSYRGYSGLFIHSITDSKEVVVYPALVDIFYERGLKEDPSYWTKRGFTQTTIDRYRLGFYDNHDGYGYYTIPIYMDGVFRNFQLRRDKPEKAIRSYYSGVGRLLFNSDIMRITDKIIITEGPTDCLRLLQEGIACISHNAGSEGWDDSWYKYFINQKRIYVVYDNDKAGRMGAQKVARNLGEYRTKIYTFSGFSDKYDICDYFRDGFTAKDFSALLERDSKFAFEIG